MSVLLPLCPYLRSPSARPKDLPSLIFEGSPDPDEVLLKRKVPEDLHAAGITSEAE